MNEHLLNTKFDDKNLTIYVFHNKPCVIVQDLGRLLGYGDDGKDLGNTMRRHWKDELIPSRDYEVLRGKKLRDFKSLTGATALSSKITNATVLYESGMDLVCVKTEKPVGRKLRRFLVDEIFPKLRRGELAETRTPHRKIDMLLDISTRLKDTVGGSAYAITILRETAILVEPALGPKFDAVDKATRDHFTYRDGGVEMEVKLKAVPVDSVVGPADSRVVPGDSTTLSGPAAVLPLLADDEKGLSMTEFVKGFSTPDLNISHEVGKAIACALNIIGDMAFGFWSLMVSDAGKRVFSWRLRKGGVEVMTKHVLAYRTAREELKDPKKALERVLSSVEPVGGCKLVYLTWRANKEHGLVTEDEPSAYETPEVVAAPPVEENDSTPVTS